MSGTVTTVDPHAPVPGSTVGPWLILARLDSGTFGIVFRAQRAGHPQDPPVALKLARHPQDPRFSREADLLQRCLHPGNQSTFTVQGSGPDRHPSTREDRRRREPAVPAWLTWASASMLGALVMALVVLLVMRPLLAHERSTPWLATREEVAQFSADAGVGEEVASAIQEKLPRIGPFVLALGRPMPSKPFPGQRRPPCGRGEREINGGCWVKVSEEEAPPCGDNMFDYDGRCYFASFNSARQPASEDP